MTFLVTNGAIVNSCQVDFSFLFIVGGRSFTPIHQSIENSDPIAEEIHNLQLFLGNPQQPHNLIMSNLKNEVHNSFKSGEIHIVLRSKPRSLGMTSLSLSC